MNNLNGTTPCACTCYSSVVSDAPEVETYYIPVVVHVIYSEESAPENIGETEIVAAINQANIYFRQINIGQNMPRIEFFLARIDPENNCTDGIVRAQSDLTLNVTNPNGASIPEPIKQVSNWGSANYLNIWIVIEITDAGGYSSFPFMGLPENQGIVIEYSKLTNSTLTHEMGHFLGLFHVFGCDAQDCIDICGANDAAAKVLNDLVPDTKPAFWPAAIDSNIDCSDEVFLVCTNKSFNLPNEEPTSCLGSHAEHPFPKRNFMSTFLNCSSSSSGHFTEGQFNRMYYHLNTLQRDIWHPGYIIKSEVTVEKETKFHRDITIHPGGKLIIEAEAIMAEGTSIKVLQGGQLEVRGGKIRGCNISETERGKWDGVDVLGRITGGFDVIFENATIEDVNGFIVDMNSSPFSLSGNGSLHAFGNSTFNNVDGLVNLASFLPAYNGSIIEDCTQNGGLYGVKDLFAEDVTIRGSKFYDIEKECISSVGGSFIIQGNKFHGDEVDVALTHLFNGRRSIINEKNVFNGQSIGIRASGSTSLNHIISDNTFSGFGVFPESDPELIDIDIYMDGITAYTIENNTFNGALGVASRATDNTNNTRFNLVNSNQFDANVTALYPFASNPDYIFSNNCFNSTRFDAYILGEMADQGDPNGDPANNCFTNQGLLNNGNPLQVIDIGGAPESFLYVEPEIVENIDCRHTVYAPTVGVNIEFTLDDPEIDCSEFIFFNPYDDDEDQLFYDQLNYVGTLISAGNFNQARIEMNNIDQSTEEGVDAYFLIDKIIEIMENQDENQNYDNLLSSLNSIALKEHASSGFAQALHYYLSGTFVDNLDTSFSEHSEVFERSKGDREEKGSRTENIDIFPNPATNHINISNSDEIVMLKVYDAIGNLIYTGTSPSQISLKNWKQGLFIIDITTISGESVVKKLILK